MRKLSEPQRAVLRHLADGEHVKSTNNGKIRVYCGNLSVRMGTLDALNRDGFIVGGKHVSDPWRSFTHWAITDKGRSAIDATND